MSEQEIEWLLAQEENKQVQMDDVLLDMKLAAMGMRRIYYKGRMIGIGPASPQGLLELREISIEDKP